MSALEFTRIDLRNTGHFITCANGCESVNDGYRLAKWHAYMCGHPAGDLCEPCKREWAKVWASVAPKVEDAARAA